MTGIAFQFKNRRVKSTVKQWAKELNVFANEIESALPLAIREGLFPIYETSQMLVPVDTGDLKESGFIDVDRSPRGRSITGVVGYGDNGFPHYALLVHENLEFFHEYPTQAKFLEEAYNRHVDDVEDIMKRFLKSFLEL